MSFIDNWKKWSNPKKAISIAIVCCIGLIIIGFIVGGVTPDKNTSNDKNYNLIDTNDVSEDNGEIKIGGKIVATVEEYNNSDVIVNNILSKDDNIIIKHITINGAKEVDSVDNYDNVYEFLSGNGFYYTFGKNGKTYIITI